MKQKILFAVILIFFIVFTGKTEVYAGVDKFSIRDYDVFIKIDKDNTYHVVETIRVKFFAGNQHGIYRNIPLKNTVKRPDGSEGTTYAKVDNVIVNTMFEQSVSGHDVVLKIGNPERYVSGEQTYIISYEYKLGNDILKNGDEFYFNLIGNGWDTVINHVSFQIVLPEEIQQNSIEFSGAEGKITSNDCNYTFNGTVLAGELNENISLYPGENLALRICLPEGYFDKDSVAPFLCLCALGLGGISLVVSFLLWLVFGRDKKPEISLENLPPEGINCLDAALVYKEKVTHKDALSLIFALASEGYLEIHELGINEGYRFRKLKTYDGKNPLEKLYMESFFAEGNVVGYHNFREVSNRTCKKVAKEANSIKYKSLFYHKISYLIQIPLVVCVFLLFVLVFAYPIGSFLGFIPFGVIFSLLLCAALLFVYWFIANRKDRVVKIILTLVFALILFVFYGLIMKPVMLPFGNLYGLMYFFAYLVGGLLLLLAGFMSKKNAYGNMLYGKILGFRAYLEAGSREQMEKMARKYENAYFDLLPFAVVLGLSKEWIHEFCLASYRRPDWFFGEQEETEFFHAWTFIEQLDHYRRGRTYTEHHIGDDHFYHDSGGFSSFDGGCGGDSGSGGGGGSSW